ncbi:hypothetical protein E2986_00644 [Frieseomelitta varia]|uniref:Protein kinase domain-containing protein n=1 Tax=Frieseomelitta varia TaxID=561572 RepID=A0A833S7A1_9HYME|nr:hypothetical protein E2986_00644 [Frieseomelitta varia]
MSLPSVSDYSLLEKIGSGSYATVYKAFKKKKRTDTSAKEKTRRRKEKKRFQAYTWSVQSVSPLRLPDTLYPSTGSLDSSGQSHKSVVHTVHDTCL